MDKISTNIDIMTTIFQFLNAKQQLKLTKVCAGFQYIIVNFIWRYKFRTLNVWKIKADIYLLNYVLENSEESFKNIFDTYYIELNEQDFQEFLKLNKDNIFKLTLNDKLTLANIEIYREEFSMEWKFPNLQEISFNNMLLTWEQLERVTLNCTNLLRLHIKQCFDKENKTITMGEDDHEYIEILKQFNKLEEFCIAYKNFHVRGKSHINLNEIFKYIQPKRLILNTPIMRLRYDEKPNLPQNKCEILNIGPFVENIYLQKFSKLYMKSFVNLQELTIEGAVNKIIIDNEFLNNLAETCGQGLGYLKFIRCRFVNIESFSIFSKLKEISLEKCLSVTWLNLQQIFQIKTLQKFQSIDSTYTDKLEPFNLSISLQELTLIGNDSRFSRILEYQKEQKFPELFKLSYYDGSENLYKNISQKFPNLKVLHMIPSNINIADVLNLKFLKTYEFPKYHDITWSYLEELLKHPSLRGLSITGRIVFDANSPTLPLSCVTCCSHLKYLKISFEIFNINIDYWLDLLKKNCYIKLIICSHDVTKISYYYNLLVNEKFMRHSLKLCGFNIDYNDFQENAKVMEQKFELIEHVAEFNEITLVL